MDEVITIDASKVIFQTPVAGMLVTDNDMEAPFDGGRVVLSLSGAANGILYEQAITGVTVLINHRRDEPMAKWPLTRAQKEGRKFRVLIVEDTE